MSAPNAALAYRVTFDRIGRNRDAPALVATADGPSHLADLILAHARRFLISSDVSVSFEEDMLSGWIFCGFRTGGTFTIERDGVCPDPACGHAASLHQAHGCVGHHGLCRCAWRPDGGEDIPRPAVTE